MPDNMIISLIIFSSSMMTVTTFREYIKARQMDRRAVIGLIIMALLLIASLTFFLMTWQHPTGVSMAASMFVPTQTVLAYHWTAPKGFARTQRKRPLLLLTGASVLCVLGLILMELSG